ncbi:Transposase [Modicisalibacter ilicicola DSM 19980]|uniref:Transposase n=1 Tax=Modicisalibacter ilicicola DSM 19980 TaxID=1121942 RepID=A0A1M5B4L1_9GAMM|nr:transposase [Halomonas ilicicola]SHF37491.1 Transposase [Halomonas ilicicola DSM 19980]
MSRQRYTEEFKIEAVKQVTERGHPVTEVAARLGVSGYSLYQGMKRYAKPAEQRQQDAGDVLLPEDQSCVSRQNAMNLFCHESCETGSVA